MKNKGISFFEDFQTRVKLNFERVKEVDANLEISINKLPVLKLENQKPFVDFKLSESEQKLLKCKTINSKGYTLINCESNGTLIFPKYVIEGIENEPFNGVEVLLTGFSSWFDQETRFDMNDAEIKKIFPKNKIDIAVCINGENYQISTNYCCEIRNIEKKDTLVSEYTTIIIKKINGVIEASEASKLVHDVRKVFSFLLGHPLSIEYTWLIVGSKNIRKDFYFCCNGTQKDPFEYPRECLIHPTFIFNHGMWETIFKNYYSSPTKETFQKIWYCLPSLFEYKGIWEYEFLGYVSILDAYCNNFTKKRRKKLPSSKYKKIKEKLLYVIDESQNEFGKEYDGLIESFKNGINGIKNTNLPTFKQKFRFLMSETDENIKNMISFTEEEFSAIKKVRDQVAHGEPVTTKDDKYLDFEICIKYKLKILLLYLVYKDFGFSSIQYAKCLSQTLCKYVCNAEISSYERDKLAGNASFYKVDESSYLEASKSDKFHVAIEYFKEDNKYFYSSEITKEIKENWILNSNKIYRNLVDHVKDFTTGTGAIDVKYISKAYLLYDKKNLELSGICLITYE